MIGPVKSVRSIILGPLDYIPRRGRPAGDAR